MAKEEEKKGAPDYMPLYVSLFLILVAFFAALLANSTFEKKRVLQAIGSIRGGFGVLEGGSKLSKGKELLFPSPDIEEKKQETESMFREYMRKTRKTGEFLLLSAVIEKLLRKYTLKKFIEVKKYKKGIVITILDFAIFPPGSSKILPSAKPMLHDIANIIRSVPYEVIISGHTDNTPVKGKFKDNWELSAKRALNVLRYLIEYEKILPEKLRASGFGEYKPRFPNDTKEHKKLNRRIEFSFEIS